MGRRTAWAAVAAVIASVGGACPAAEYDLPVELRTDFVPGADFVATRAELFRSAPDEASESMTREDRPAFGTFFTGQEIASWRLAPGRYFVRGQLLAPDGSVLAEAVGVTELPHLGDVELVITHSCRDVRCVAGMTCKAGSCVSIDCLPGSCANECSGDLECAGTAACAVGRCEDGACWFDSESGACAPGEYCDPDVGCVERPDAGVPRDAGPGGVDGGSRDGGAGLDAGPSCVPDCSGRNCDLDPVCGAVSCGACGAMQTCSGGVCTDVPPDCSGLSCGPARNGIGGPDACGTCAAGYTCSGGSCVCGAHGAGCVAGSCCSPLVCGSGGACCTQIRNACGSAAECCPGRACQMGVCCVVIGDGCSMDDQCCNGHDCNLGRCCVRIGMGCSSDGQCCTNDCFMGACR